MQFVSNGPKILVAENDRAILEMLQIRLDVAGYHTFAVRSGAAALEIVRNTRPAVMVLGLNLPEMNGFDVLGALRACGGAALPTLVISRQLGSDEVRRAVSLGARDCMTKPFSGAALLERVGRLMRLTPDHRRPLRV